MYIHGSDGRSHERGQVVGPREFPIIVREDYTLRPCGVSPCGWNGFGLFSIEQQLRPIGGSLEILSSAASGTRAIVILPLTSEGAMT